MPTPRRWRSTDEQALAEAQATGRPGAVVSELIAQQARHAEAQDPLVARVDALRQVWGTKKPEPSRRKPWNTR